MKSFDKIKSDPRVHSFDDDGDDGFWLIFKTGWADHGFDPGAPIHGIHERTIRDVLRRMKDVRPCACPDCAAFAARIAREGGANAPTTTTP